MNDELLRAAVAHKHDNILPAETMITLQQVVIPLNDSTSLNNYIIHSYSYATPDTQYSLMTDFLSATIEELEIRGGSLSYWWNIAETRSLIDLSLVHIFNKVINVLNDEGYIYGSRYAKGVITEGHLLKSKEAVIYRLDGS